MFACGDFDAGDLVVFGFVDFGFCLLGGVVLRLFGNVSVWVGLSGFGGF